MKKKLCVFITLLILLTYSNVYAGAGEWTQSSWQQVNGVTDIPGPVTVTGDLTVSGETTLNDSLTVSKSTSLSSNEALANTTFASTAAGWTVTAPCVLSTGFITCTGPGTGTIKQTSANMAKAPAISNLYRLLYNESTVTNTPIATLKATGGMSDADVLLTITQDNGLFNFFQSASAPTEFLIEVAVDAGDVLVFSKLSLEQSSFNASAFGRVYGNLWINGDPTDFTRISRIMFTEEGLVNPITDSFPHNGYGYIGRENATGILDVLGFGTGDGESLHLRGFTADTAPVKAVISIDAYKYDSGTYVTDLAPTEMIAAFQNTHTDKVVVYGDGDIETLGCVWMAEVIGQFGTALCSETVTLTAAQVKTLATPFEIVAGRTGALLEFVSAVAILNYAGTGNWAEPSAPDDLVFEYETTSTGITGDLDATNFIDQTNDEVRWITVGRDLDAGLTIDSDMTSESGEGIMLHNTGGNYTDNGGTPTSTLSIKITYKVYVLGL